MAASRPDKPESLISWPTFGVASAWEWLRELMGGGALGIAVTTSIYSLAAVPGRYVSGLPAAFLGGAVIALVAALTVWISVRSLTAERGDDS